MRITVCKRSELFKAARDGEVFLFCMTQKTIYIICQFDKKISGDTGLKKAM